MRERLSPVFGHAIIGQFSRPAEGRGNVNSVNQFDLHPGEGLLFVGVGDNPEPPIRFSQDQIAETLKGVPEGKQVQLMAILDRGTGGLLFTDLSEQGSIGLAPGGPKTMAANFGKITFAGILGSSRKDAYQTLSHLQAARRRLN